jgi:murein DD-endopeptidase MepM/ murein hydrolase activator NlpD
LRFSRPVINSGLMGPYGSGERLVKFIGQHLPTGRRGVLVYLLVLAAGGWVISRALHRRFASRELLAYETSLAAYGPARMANERPIFTDQSLPARTTFSQFLSSQGVDARTADAMVREVRPVYDLGRVRAGNDVQIARNARGDLLVLSYQIDPDRVLQISRAGDIYQGRILQVPYKIATVGISGRVQDSLIQAVEDLGEHDQLALQVADIFGWDMDFNTDTQPGDTFAVEVEKKTLNGEFQSYGRVLAAEYHNGSKTFQAILFHDPEGRPAYYAPSGKSMKKAFLRSPLRFAARITSRFSYSRYHPILKRYRPHLGIDYGAPVGSAVQAVADGRVEYAGWRGEGGKEIRLHHAMGYETYYLHLSQILVKPGQFVQQGQIIARTGQTGLATGPHLDFRITQHGRFRNFLALNLPPAESVAPRDLEEFVAKRTMLLEQLASLSPPPANTQQMAQNTPEPSTAQGR